MWPKPNQLLLWSAIAVAGVMGWQHYQKVYEDKGRLLVSVEGETAFLSWHTGVDLPMARRMIEAFDRSKAKVKRIVIDLSSPGGSLYEGAEVIKVIDHMKQSHRVDTHVGERNICLSMCVPIFLRGHKRYAARSSRWMFHEPYYADAFSGEKTRKPKFEVQYTARKFFRRYFTNSQMDPVWRARLEKEWKGKEVWKTGLQLFEEKSNIVTDLF